MLKNSSEIVEAVELFTRLFAESTLPPEPAPLGFALKNAPMQEGASPPRASSPLQQPQPSATPAAPAVPQEPIHHDAFTDEKLNITLRNLNRRAGFSSALILDNEGLLLASEGEAYDESLLSAAAAILGSSLERVEALFSISHESSLSVDISFSEKAVLTRFSLGAGSLFILVTCPYENDVREELELTISEIRDILQ